VFLILPAISTWVNLSLSYFGFFEYSGVFKIIIVVYCVALVVCILILRKDRHYYVGVAVLFMVANLILFFTVLIIQVEDEFRLIGVFVAMLITYVLLGKKAGILSTLVIAAGVLFVSNVYDLQLSALAYNTFFTFFIIISAFMYFFLQKIERDSMEFELLSERLEDKVKQETSQRMKQEQMLLRRSRMANLGEMLDSIAHQWRQPLMHVNSILLNIESAVDTNSDNKNKEYLKGKLDEVANLTTHMSQTIEDFRGLFKVEKEYASFDLRNVVRDVLALLKNNLNDIEIESNDSNSVSVLGHRSELMQVIIIVLSNAVDVLNSRETRNKKIVIKIKSTKDEASISIEDNAGGVSQDDIHAVFDPYFTTKEQSGGTGLGLYIARIIVEHNMEGSISIANTAAGAKFSILMPREPSKKPSKSMEE